MTQTNDAEAHVHTFDQDGQCPCNTATAHSRQRKQELVHLDGDSASEQDEFCPAIYSGRGCGSPVGHGGNHRFLRDLRVPPEKQYEPGAVKQDVAPAKDSELGEFWRTRFGAVGEHGTVDVIHATTKLVIAEREIAVRDAVAPIQAALAKAEVVQGTEDRVIVIFHRKSDWEALKDAIK